MNTKVEITLTEPEAETKVDTYRKKHRRCKTCVYAELRYLGWSCQAKNQRYYNDLDETIIKGFGCKIYTPKPFESKLKR